MRQPGIFVRRGVGALLALLASAPLARGEDRRLRAVDGALAAVETESGVPPAMAGLLADLERQDAARRREFAAAASRKLAGKAAERLARTREAYEAGQGRLVAILRRLARATPAGPAASGARPAVGAPERLGLAREAREILARIARSAEPEPISAGNLSVVAPALGAPALGAPALGAPALGAGQAAAATSEHPIDSVPEVLKTFAATLAGPVDVYEWVRSSVRPDFYYGAMKGPVQAYLEGSANDADSAALVIALSRAKAIPARYVRGTVELPAATLQSLTGTPSAEQAVRVLDRAGIPHEAVLGSAGIASVRMERVWAEAYLPYANYRGTGLDAQGKVWVPLDPGFKRLQAPRGLDVARELGFDARALLDSYLGAPQSHSPLGDARDEVTALLAAQRPGLAYADVLNQRGSLSESLGLLPSSLPYAVVTTSETSYDVPDTLRHTLRIVAESEGTVLDVTLPTADVLGRRLTLSYTPATDEDATVAAAYGGLARTPPYLIEVRPVVKLGGVPVAVGTGTIGMGVRFTLRVELGTPGGTQTVTNRVLAGNLTAIGIGGRAVTGPEEQPDHAAAILSRLAWDYLGRWNESDDGIADLTRVVPVRPTVSVCFVMSDIQVEYAGGDPLYPLDFDWRGIAVDADHRASAPVGLESAAQEKAFLILSGLEGSVLEHRIFEEELGVDSVSTAKGLGLAHEQGIDVIDVTGANVDSVLAGLPLDTSVLDDIRQAVARGFVARVPVAPVTRLTWRGAAYVLLDDETGEAAYQLQGGRSGGVTAAAVIDIPRDLRDVLELQGETPAPETADVARVQKFGTTDFQEDTVNAILKRPLKVLVTDADGFPVPKAPVTFTVIGGGGVLIDPLTEKAMAGDLTVLADERGEAQARLQLGKRTDVIPRFTTLDGDAEATQVGLNLVTVRAGSAVLAEPFTAIAFPDDQDDGTTRKAFVRLLGDRVVSGLNNLRVAGRIAVAVEDPYGNPISNFKIRFSSRRPAVQVPPPEGASLFDGPTDTPGFVLSADDYKACVARFANPGWGECAGESPSIVVASSASGASAYAVVGDSPYSLYFFDVDTNRTTGLVSMAFGTWGYVCFSPSLDACPVSARPETFVSSGTRAVTVNRLGNVVEAYPLRGDAQAVFWAEAVIEKERIDRTVDGQGNVHYFAVGTNQWRRERLTDSTFTIEALTPGTQASASATHIGAGNYAAVMTMAPVPELNAIRASGTHLPPVIPYLSRAETPGASNEVDPAYVDPLNLTLTRVKDPDRPWQGPVPFSVWGVEAALTNLRPTPVPLDSGGAVARGAAIAPRISPEEFRQLLDPAQVVFAVKRDGIAVLAATGSTAADFVIPAGLPVPPGDYAADLTVNGLTLGQAPIVSPPFPIPVCRLLRLSTDKVVLPLVRDPANGTACGEGALLAFDLCRDAQVTFTVDGREVPVLLDRSVVPAPVTGATLAAGTHTLTFPPELLGLADGAEATFEMAASDVSDPTLREQADGTIVSAARNRSVLPVGHTFVKDVDLLDGHVVHRSIDLRVPGRHLGLEVERTYSSAGRSPEGAMGAGWSFNYASSLFEGGCGLVTVVTADGASQVFRTPDGGLTFTPQKGYHTRLVRNADLSYDFTDKGGIRHHFREPQDPTRPTGARRLEYIEEPHGDRIVLSYDGAGRVTTVAEVQGGDEVRTLVATYVSAGGSDRVAKITAPGLALEVQYTYGTYGNLVQVKRSGANVAGPAAAPWTWAYDYSTSDGRDRHQLTAAVDPNGNRTEYAYLKTTDPFPGEDAARLLQPKEEYAKAVREFPSPGVTLTTQFQYDYREVSSLTWKATVRDARGNDTLYVLNGNGATVELREPLGKTTRTEWASDDIVRTKETDPLGRITEYGHDARGNVTSERILTSDLGVVETLYEFHPVFNKLTRKKDAEGRETRYEIDPGSGDLLSQTDAVLNVTRYGYDVAGQLTSVTDPRGHVTAHSNQDSFGNARTITDALGNATTREYDARERLVHETDTLGHDTATIYDGLDRPLSVTRVAGGSSDDEVIATEYYPGGEAKAVTNALGARTAFTIDGLSRVIKTSVTVGAQTLTTGAAYDANGNKETETDARGIKRKHTYDELNRLVNTEVVGGISGEGPVGQIAAYSYDLLGNKLTETDVNSLTTRFEYDGLYRVSKKILPQAKRTGTGNYEETYGHDAVGNQTRFVDANGKVTEREHDGLNRVIKVTHDVGGLGLVTTAAYDDPEGSHLNKSEERDVAKGLRTSFLHDALNRETSRTVRLEGAGGGGAAQTSQTAYEDAGHRQRITDARGAVTRRTLDGLDRVIEETVDVAGLAGAPLLNLTTTITYNGLGNRKEVTDPEDHATRHDYDGLGRLIKTTDAKGQENRYTYFGDSLKESETDRRGVKTLFTYDTLGRLRKTRLESAPFSGVAWSRETAYIDGPQPRRIETDARAKTTIFDLDGMGRVVRETDHLGQYRTFAWDGVNKVEETDNRRLKTSFEYDGVNRLTKTTDPLLKTVTALYEDAQNRATETDERGHRKVTQSDPLGRVLSITGAVGLPEEAILETNTYDAGGNRETQTDGEGSVTRFVYDAANRLASRTAAFGTANAKMASYAYDRAGNVLEERDARAAEMGEPWSVKNTYDELNRLTTSQNGETQTTTWGYDEEANRTSEQAPAGGLTSFTYNERGKLLGVTEPPPAPGEPRAVTEYAYDAADNRTGQTDGRGEATRYEHDDIGRLKSTTQDPGGLNLVTETARFDANGNPEVIVDPKGQTITSTFDEKNRVKTRSYAFAAGDAARPWRHTTFVEYTYDGKGNLLRQDETVASGTDPPALSASIVRTYDALDRLASETISLPEGGSKTITYTYYRNGLRKTASDPESGLTAYSYDELGRLKTVTTNLGSTAYTYFGDGLLHTLSEPDGTLATYAYDKADRLLSVTHTKGEETVSSYAYTYDVNGNRLTQVETNGAAAEATGYGYDGLDRLMTVSYPDKKVAYGYDAVGNRTRETETTLADVVVSDKQGAFDAVNRLETLTDLAKPEGDPSRVVSFRYDPNGNQASKTENGVTTGYLYDVRDKVVEVQQGTSVLARYQFDAEGRLLKKIGEDGIRQYVYDQASRLAEYDDDGQRVAKYSYGSDRLISLEHLGEGTRFYHLDGLGSVTALTDPTGTVTSRLHLDPWGIFRDRAELNSSANRFAFTGFVFEREVDLYFARSRFYDASVGRFTSADTFPGKADDPPSLHRFAYARSAPTRYIDPTGHEAANAGCYYGPSSCSGQAAATFSKAEMAASDTAAWTLGSVLRTGFETVKGIVNLIRLGVDQRTQMALAAKLVEKAPTAARAAAGDYLAQTELLEPVVTSRIQAYQHGIDEYADAPSPFVRGWSATGTVFPEASIAAGGVAGLARGGGRALAAVVQEPGATVASAETLNTLQGAQAFGARTAATETAAAETQVAAIPRLPRIAGAVVDAPSTALEGPNSGVARGRLDLAGTQHPVSGVRFNERGFPEFESLYDVTIPNQLRGPKVSDAAQFRAATREVRETLRANPELRQSFTAEQLTAIDGGQARIPGLTWHHAEDGVTLQLVDRTGHRATGHAGGRQATGGRP